MTRPLIPLRDYERIYKTIYSVLMSENADREHAALYFSLFGAGILIEHYKLDACPRAGIAGYGVGNDENNVLMFAEPDGDRLTCTKNGFHCWIEVSGWLIDFMAPVFPHVMRKRGHETPCKPMMMQKKLDDMVESYDSLKRPGDFRLSVSPGKMENLFEHFESKPVNADLMEISTDWYRRPPGDMNEQISMSDGRGNIIKVPYIGESLVGSW